MSSFEIPDVNVMCNINNHKVILKYIFVTLKLCYHLQGSRLLESNFINNTSMVFGLCLRVRDLSLFFGLPRHPYDANFLCNVLMT